MRYVFPILLGIVGAAILAGLGIWQTQRLPWKENLIATIESRIAADPVAIPAAPDPDADAFLRVEVAGRLTGPEIHRFGSKQPEGPGYWVIRAVETAQGRRVLVDLGFIPTELKDAERPETAVRVIGNLDWPEETNFFTNDPNFERNVWFARDVPSMAAHLGTEPILVVAARVTPEIGIVAEQVSPNLPNNHLQYAITWFLMLAGWIGMTGYWLWRIRTGKA